jgi:hypothetical protein
MNESTFARYTDILLTLVPELFPDYSEPMKAHEYCSAAYLALVWLASDDLDSGHPQQVLEKLFLLAFVFVKSNGYSWMRVHTAKRGGFLKVQNVTGLEYSVTSLAILCV